jgi:hypothetical protein
MERRVLTILTVAVLLPGVAILLWSKPVAAQDGWYAEYFGNPDLSGTPAVTGYEADLDHDWGQVGPDPLIPVDNFSARWTRDVSFETATYRFFYRADDGIRIWIGDRLVVDQWYDSAATWSYVDHFVQRGIHLVRVEYYEHSGRATIGVSWERIEGSGSWRAEYFDSPDLTGAPALVRLDPVIDFDWGAGGPVSWMPADHFSVVWTRQVLFEPGYYRFNVQFDDGVRVWLDSSLVMDYLQSTGDQRHSLNWTYLDGVHTVRIAYLEITGNASIRFWWEERTENAYQPSLPASEQVPWEGMYFDNRDLLGAAVMIRSDPVIDFDWGEGAPAGDLPDDGFSVRWSGRISFEPGIYLLYAQADDGIRVYLDGKTVIDQWHVSNGQDVYAVDLPLNGVHKVVIDYFEATGQAQVSFWWNKVGGG